MRAAAGLLAVVALASSCSGGSSRSAAPSPVTTTPTTTTTVPPSTASIATTTTPTTAAASLPSTTSPASSPEAHAQALYEAWTRGDRAAAERVAEPGAVAALFARQPGDGWSFVGCTGAAGSVICTWQRPAGQLLFRVQSVAGGGPVLVSDVRFQP